MCGEHKVRRHERMFPGDVDFLDSHCSVRDKPLVIEISGSQKIRKQFNDSYESLRMGPFGPAKHLYLKTCTAQDATVPRGRPS